MRPRTLVIVTGALVLHGAGLWALQSGLLRRVVEVIVPVEVLSELITPPAPKPEPPPPAPKVQPSPSPSSHNTAPQPTRPVAPQPLAVADNSPAPNAVTGVLTPQPPAPPIATPVQTAPPAPPAPPKVELLSCDYLYKPTPAYPALSKRLGEQGKVQIRVLIGIDGNPQKAEIETNSGYDRLDQAALATALKWRYVPGKRAGVAEVTWCIVPINFVLE
jgi:protein TonB